MNERANFVYSAKFLEFGMRAQLRQLRPRTRKDTSWVHTVFHGQFRAGKRLIDLILSQQTQQVHHPRLIHPCIDAGIEKFLGKLRIIPLGEGDHGISLRIVLSVKEKSETGYE